MSLLTLSGRERESSLVQNFCLSCVHLDLAHLAIYIIQRFVIHNIECNIYLHILSIPTPLLQFKNSFVCLYQIFSNNYTRHKHVLSVCVKYTSTVPVYCCIYRSHVACWPICSESVTPTTNVQHADSQI